MAAIFTAVMTVFIVIRHTRADEEAGRLELAGSAAVGRQAALTAGLLTAVTANAAISGLLCLTLPLAGLPVAGSAALALAIGACGLAFTGITAVAVQLASGARAARGIALGALGGSTQLRQEFTRLGGQAAITDAYLAALMLLAALAAAGYATSAVLRLRAEESGGLAEPLLATATGRVRWGLSQLAVAVVGAAVLLAVAGVAAGLGYGLRAGSAGSQAARLLGAAMAQLPASLVLAGLAVALAGLLPRACVAGAWTAFGAVLVLDLFGQALRVSHWVLDISPFTHAPRLPGGTVSSAPLLWLCLAAATFSLAGLAGLRRRDIG